MTTDAERSTDAMTPLPEQRRRRVSLRLVVLIAAVFAVLAVLFGGAGLVMGKIASGGAGEHRYQHYSFYEEHGHGPGPLGEGHG